MYGFESRPGHYIRPAHSRFSVDRPTAWATHVHPMCTEFPSQRKSDALGGLDPKDAGGVGFLLAPSVIFAAGVLKLRELFGTAGDHIHGEVNVRALIAGIAAYGQAHRGLTRRRTPGDDPRDRPRVQARLADRLPNDGAAMTVVCRQ